MLFFTFTGPLYHSLGTFSAENVSVLNRIQHVCAQCVNWSAGIRYLHSCACPSIVSFCLRITYCDIRERDNDRNIIIFQILVHLLLFSRVSYCDDSELAIIFAYKTKKKEYQNTRQSDLFSGSTPLLKIK
jgi:hypothetical protein